MKAHRLQGGHICPRHPGDASSLKIRQLDKPSRGVATAASYREPDTNQQVAPRDLHPSTESFKPRVQRFTVHRCNPQRKSAQHRTLDEDLIAEPREPLRVSRHSTAAGQPKRPAHAGEIAAAKRRHHRPNVLLVGQTNCEFAAITGLRAHPTRPKQSRACGGVGKQAPTSWSPDQDPAPPTRPNPGSARAEVRCDTKRPH